MSTAPLKIAVVGHTNTGKTSLLRTVTRDVTFGEISDRPATTRHVEAVTLFAAGAPAIEFFDTPGLEDSGGLLGRLEDIRSTAGVDWTDAIHRFLDDAGAQEGFAQEAKALRQVLACDVALYVIDARDRILGKHRDELEILARCARPVVPVLNFVADAEAKPDPWREQLARVNMHATIAFDTVVFDEVGELRLYEKLRTLLDRFEPALTAVIADAKERRSELRHASANLVAELLIDVAAYVDVVPSRDQDAIEEALDKLRQLVRQAEERCVAGLLSLYRFRPGDYLPGSLPIVDGKWGLDLFSPQSMVSFGVTTGSGAATGALAGLAVDVMVGGITLGAAAATGAAIGGLIGAAGSRGREVVDRLRGYTELRVDDRTLDLLALRQLALVRALLARGHASQDRIRLAEGVSDEANAALAKSLHDVLPEARHRPDWTRLRAKGGAAADGGRGEARERLATRLFEALEG